MAGVTPKPPHSAAPTEVEILSLSRRFSPKLPTLVI